MKNQIIIREAISEADTAAFWEQLHSYHDRDIFLTRRTKASSIF